RRNHHSGAPRPRSRAVSPRLPEERAPAAGPRGPACCEWRRARERPGVPRQVRWLFAAECDSFPVALGTLPRGLSPLILLSLRLRCKGVLSGERLGILAGCPLTRRQASERVGRHRSHGVTTLRHDTLEV